MGWTCSEGPWSYCASIFTNLVGPNKPSTLKFEVHSTSFTKNELDLLFTKWIKIWTYELPKNILWAYDSKMQKTYYEYSDTVQKLCEDAVLNKKLVKKLQNTDLMLFLDMPFLLVASCCLNYLTYLWSTVFDLPLTIQMKNSVEGSYYLLPMYLLSYQNLVTKGHLWRW